MKGTQSFDERLLSHFECGICCKLMTPPGRVPMVTECGHTICKECYDQLTINGSDHKKCAFCNKELRREAS